MPNTVVGTRKDAVLRQLRDEIVSSELKPGTVLKDAEVAARLGVSITPVREAIGQLAAEGLVDTAPNRTRHVTHITHQNALELIDVMQVLACAGFEWGAKHLDQRQLTQLRGTFEELADAVARDDLAAAATAGVEFTTIVVQASGNRELQTHIDLVRPRSVRVLALITDHRIWPIWLDGYRETLEFLEAGDPAGALDRYRSLYTQYHDYVQTLRFPGIIPE